MYFLKNFALALLISKSKISQLSKKVKKNLRVYFFSCFYRYIQKLTPKPNTTFPQNIGKDEKMLDK